ncbi:hypothetical protein [Pseudomonas sp. SLFW]|uniref:hypothetical protein n=1 Tax=Pseudomonas sp. SLFW TaxID=2683259 RepID=UPI001412F63B|nr:hypothetical protein [Pseudomonas sp. SLFW]NBB12464.1 hypothetical protein [Pseudomonas sp. SLFW]
MRKIKTLCASLALALPFTHLSGANAEVPESPAPHIEALPDKLNTVIGTLDNDSDVKYYSFTALRGQKFMVHDVQRGPNGSQWKIEYKIDEDWKPVPTFDSYISAPLQPEQEILVRVAKASGIALPPGRKFHIEFGSAPFTRHTRVSGDAEQFSIFFSTPKFMRQVDWGASIEDSTGHPVEGATVEFTMAIEHEGSTPSVISKRTTGLSGGISETIKLKDCHGTKISDPFVGVYDFKTKWQVSYNTGHWHISVQGNKQTGVSPVPFAHICSAKIVR